MLEDSALPSAGRYLTIKHYIFMEIFILTVEGIWHTAFVRGSAQESN
jgi:hypothetical protein